MRRKNKKGLIFLFVLIIALYNLTRFEDKNTLIIIMSIIILLLVANSLYKRRIYYRLHNLVDVNRRRYKSALEALDGAIWEWSSKNNELFISDKIKEILGINQEVTCFDQWFNYISDDEREDIVLYIENVIENRSIDDFILEPTFINENDEKLNIQIKGNGKIINNIFFLTGSIKNITEMKKIQRVNTNSNDRNRLALEVANEIVFWWNVNENIISIGSAIRKYLGIPGNGDLLIPDKKWQEYIMDEDIKDYLEKINNTLNSPKNELYSIDYRIKGVNNKSFWIQSKGKKVVENNGNIFIYGALSDITARKEKEIEISYLSYNDDVTGIPNRRYFVREINNRLKNYANEKMAIIFIDLDNFKYINDTYGHDLGDSLLFEFCKCIKDMNIKDSLFARYGGDEFVLVKYNLQTKNEIKDILDNIIKNLSKPMMIKNKEIFCSLSIGVSIYPTDGMDMGILLKRADMAMYLAKINGKNRYEFFDSNILEILNREFDIEKGLRVAIDNDEIRMLYQPKVSVCTGEVVGFESLVRWYSRELGLVSPNEFIPVAESSGLIISIGKYIIQESLKKCKELSLKTDKKFKMAINLSEVQIRDDEIVSFIDETIKKLELDSSYVEFEITESIIMKYPEKNIETLERLKKLGVTLALDDFGTGYSSLSYLRTLPIDVLKIDKSFIDGILIEEKCEYIINSIIELSHYLNLTVVAEGVETKEQLEYLSNISCDLIQGYYFSRPIKFEDASKMIFVS
ncbi:EAL domain-containing protein [Clostridium tertium]|uniref:Cyclic di-GMP phosphodiesterase Gmr n=1 Tax=Clostridium tertium TaxID=1559 RepID=A0A6N3EPZ9_9CLOT